MSIAISVTRNIEAGWPQSLLVVPANSSFTGNIRLTNRNQTEVTVRVAITKTATPDPADYIEYDVVIPGNEVLEDTGLVLTAGEFFYISTSVSSVSVRIHGYQESA